jgi:hypothetical protein
MKRLIILTLAVVGMFTACTHTNTTTETKVDSTTVTATDSPEVEVADTTATDSIN